MFAFPALVRTLKVLAPGLWSCCVCCGILLQILGIQHLDITAHWALRLAEKLAVPVRCGFHSVGCRLDRRESLRDCICWMFRSNMYNNALQSLPVGSFDSLTSLLSLYVVLLSIPTFIACFNLVRCSAARNNTLASLPTGILNSLTSMKYL